MDERYESGTIAVEPSAEKASKPIARSDSARST